MCSHSLCSVVAQENSSENEQLKTDEENEQGKLITTSHHFIFLYAYIHTCFSGSFTFKLNSRKHTIELTARTEDVGIKWVNAIQEVRNLYWCSVTQYSHVWFIQQVIDNCPPIQTITEKLVLHIIVSSCLCAVRVYVYM